MGRSVQQSRTDGNRRDYPASRSGSELLCGSGKIRHGRATRTNQPPANKGRFKTTTITPGQIKLKMDSVVIAALLNIDQDNIDVDALTITASFQMRRRGVETKLIIGDAPSGQDEVLIRNIAKAHHGFAQFKSGKTFTGIASSEGTSKRRIQQMIDLAFLVPDNIRDVLVGKQPIGFSSDWYKQHGLPSDWTTQCQLLATL